MACGSQVRQKERESEGELNCLLAACKQERESCVCVCHARCAEVLSTAPLLGGLCCLLASEGRRGVNLDCYSRGAFPFLPAVLESYACHFVEEARRARKKGLQ